jgi:hypothetical protein
VPSPLRRVRLGGALAAGSAALSAATLYAAAAGGRRSWPWILVLGSVGALAACILLRWRRRALVPELYVSVGERRLRPFIVLLGVSALVTTRALLPTSSWYLPAGCAALFVTLFFAQSVRAMRLARWIERALAGRVTGVSAPEIAGADGSWARIASTEEPAYRVPPRFIGFVPLQPWRALVRARGAWSALAAAMIALGLGVAHGAHLPSVVRAHLSVGAEIRRLPDDPHVRGASLWEVRYPEDRKPEVLQWDPKPIDGALRLYVDEKTGDEIDGVELFLRRELLDPEELADAAFSALLGETQPHELCYPRARVGSMMRNARPPARIEGARLRFRVTEMTGDYPSFLVSDVVVDLRTGGLAKEPVESFVVSGGLPSCKGDAPRE